MTTTYVTDVADATLAVRPLIAGTVVLDEHVAARAAWSAVGAYEGRSHLALDLHFLLFAWADNADDESRILGRAMQVIEDTPIVSGPLLAGNFDWAPHEALQILLEDLEPEMLIRLFETLPIRYRLGAPYVARVLRIDGQIAPVEPPVATATIRVRS